VIVRAEHYRKTIPEKPTPTRKKETDEHQQVSAQASGREGRQWRLWLRE
jgi:hypothetical protein